MAHNQYTHNNPLLNIFICLDGDQDVGTARFSNWAGGYAVPTVPTATSTSPGSAVQQEQHHAVEPPTRGPSYVTMICRVMFRCLGGLNKNICSIVVIFYYCWCIREP